MTAQTAERVGVEFEDFQKFAAEQIPLRRVGQPEDIAVRDRVPLRRTTRASSRAR